VTEEILLQIAARLGRVEATLDATRSPLTKEWYTTGEVAALLGRARYTVREWARHGRCRAVKRGGRGEHGEWWLSKAEVERLQNEGLLPIRPENVE
jgi:excisionase family DNA binding protein